MKRELGERPRALPTPMQSPSTASARSPVVVPRRRSPGPADSGDQSDSSPAPTRGDPSALHDTASKEATTGRKRGGSPFADEVQRQRQRTEVAYVEQLQSLATAARTLEGMLRLAGGAGSAESALGQPQLEGLLVAAVCDVRTLLEQDRRQRDQLRQELRSVAASFKSCPSPPAQAEAQLEVVTLKRELLQALSQLQTERQTAAALAKMHERECSGLMEQLRSQAAEITRLQLGASESVLPPPSARPRLDPAASLRARGISLPELLLQHD